MAALELPEKTTSTLMDILFPCLVRIQLIHALRERRSNTGINEVDFDVRPEMRTGFLAWADHSPVVLTAGHVLEELSKFRIGQRRVIKWGISGCNTPNVIELQDTDCSVRYFFDERTGEDWGLVQLPEQVANQVGQAGSRFVPREVWEPRHFEPHLFVALGFPREQRTLRAGESTGPMKQFVIRAGTPMLQLEPIQDDSALTNKIVRIRARIMQRYGAHGGEPIVLQSINGMSGGPIFAIGFAPEGLRLLLIGMLTEETEETDFVRGVFVKDLLRWAAGANGVSWKEDRA